MIEKYEKLADCEDLTSLIALSEEDIEDIEDVQGLVEAIESILNVWHYDFACGKFPRIQDSQYINGLEALESLQGVRLGLHRADYFLMISEDKGEQDPVEAMQWIDKAYAEVKSVLSEAPDNMAAQHKEIDCLKAKLRLLGYQQQPILYRKILSLCAQSAADFPGGRIWYSWLGEIIKGNAESSNWAVYKTLSRRLYTWNKLTALVMVDTLIAFSSDKKRPATLLEELLFWLELAKGETHDQLSSQHQFNSTGHHYVTASKVFNEEWMLQHALHLFSRCAEVYPDSWSPAVYAGSAMQKLLAFKQSGKSRMLQRYQEICNHYIESLKRMPSDFTLLVHACDFMRIYLNAASNDVKQHWINQKRIEWSLAAQRQGGGYYFSPYQHLIESYILLEEYDEIEKWLIVGFLALSLLVDNNLKKLFGSPVFKKNLALAKLMGNIEMYQTKYKDSAWYGGEDAERLRDLTLEELRAEFKVFCKIDPLLLYKKRQSR